MTVTKYRQVMLSSCGVSVGPAQHIGTLTATASQSSAAAVAGLHEFTPLLGPRHGRVSLAKYSRGGGRKMDEGSHPKAETYNVDSH